MSLLLEMHHVMAQRTFWLVMVVLMAAEISVGGLGAILTGLKAEIGVSGRS